MLFISQNGAKKERLLNKRRIGRANIGRQGDYILRMNSRPNCDEKTILRRKLLDKAGGEEIKRY